MRPSDRGMPRGKVSGSRVRETTQASIGRPEERDTISISAQSGDAADGLHDTPILGTSRWDSCGEPYSVPPKGRPRNQASHFIRALRVIMSPASCTIVRYLWPRSPSRGAGAPSNPAMTAPRRKSLSARRQTWESVPPPAGPVHAGVRQPPAAARPEWSPPDHSWVWVRPHRGPTASGPHLRSYSRPFLAAPQGLAEPGPLTMQHRAVPRRPHDPPAPPAHQMVGLHRSREVRSRACLSRCDPFRPQSRKHPLTASSNDADGQTALSLGYHSIITATLLFCQRRLPSSHDFFRAEPIRPV